MLDRWDAIVVGAGLGGLTTAAYLAVCGRRVLVLEQGDTAGGCGQVFRRKRRWEFDVGVHYVGDCAEGGVLPALLRGLGLEGRIEFLPMDPDGFDTLVFPDLTVKVPRGWEAYGDRLAAIFPEQAAGLRRCLGVLERVGREVITSDPPLTPGAALRMPVRTPNLMRWGMRPLARLFDACGLDERARGVLAGQCGTHGAPPSRVPVALHAAILHHYVSAGGFYPAGGGQVLAARLVQVVQAHGGRVRTRAAVQRITVEGRRVTGVRLDDGERIDAPVVVSGADYKRTMLELVGPEHLPRRRARRAEALRMALPIFMVYLGLDLDLRERMPNTNYWYFPGGFDVEGEYAKLYDPPRAPAARDAWLDTLPAYVSSASVKDPGNPRAAPPGHSSAEVMGIVPADPALWGGEPGGHGYRRSGAYRAAKAEVTDALIRQAARLLGDDLPGRVVWQEAATPLTQARYTRASDGSSYGLELATDQFGPRRPGPRTPLKGLFLCGAGTVWGHGVVGVMTGGVGAASAVLGRDLRGEVTRGAVLGDPLAADPPGWDPLLACKRLSVKPRARASRPPSPPRPPRDPRSPSPLPSSP